MKHSSPEQKQLALPCHSATARARARQYPRAIYAERFLNKCPLFGQEQCQSQGATLACCLARAGCGCTSFAAVGCSCLLAAKLSCSHLGYPMTHGRCTKLPRVTARHCLPPREVLVESPVLLRGLPCKQAAGLKDYLTLSRTQRCL